MVAVGCRHAPAGRRCHIARLLVAAGTCAVLGLLLIPRSAPADHRPNHNPGGGGGGGGGDAILSPVILANDHASLLIEFWLGPNKRGGRIPVMFGPGGGKIEHIYCPSSYGDLTHGGGTRFVADYCGPTFTNNCASVRIVAESDDCIAGSPTYQVDLFNDPNFTFTFNGGGSQLRWSPDGSRLLFSATQNGVVGIFVGEVLFDGSGRPNGLTDGVSGPSTVKMVLDLSALGHGVRQARWSGDNQRICFELPDAAGDGDVWVLDVGAPGGSPGSLVNVTNTSGVHERDPDFSPLPGDNRIVYSRFMYPVPSNDRYDLFVLDLDSSVETQVTNESNAGVEVIREPAWSPDAQNLVFGAGGNPTFGSNTKMGAFRIATDGSGFKRLTRWKVISAGGPTGSNGIIFRVQGPFMWRD